MKKRFLSMLLIITLCLLLMPAATSAKDEDVALKDAFHGYFKTGVCTGSNELYTTAGKSFVLKHFNSISCKDELKPEFTLDQTACQKYGNNTNTQVTLNGNTEAILFFCETNHIPLRGNYLVWHKQTPDWFFKEGFNTNGSYVSEEVMNQRLESYIKNLFALIARDYPNLEIYAWDVVNEAFTDDNPSEMHPSSKSGWTMVYCNNNSFIYKAFEYAQKYKPEGCLLCYNDYGEYTSGKIKAIPKLCKDLYEKGLMDAIGLESHLAVDAPSVESYRKAIETYASIGCPIMITELDVRINGKSLAEQSKYYGEIFEIYAENKEHIMSVTFADINDKFSWYSEEKPLLFDRDYQPKEGFYAVLESAVYSIAFESNGGSAIASVRGKYGTAVDLNQFVPKKDGFDFGGWYSDKALTAPVKEIKLTADKTVYAKWIKKSAVFPFTDVDSSAWSYKDIFYVWEKGLMNGISGKEFGPKIDTSRAMIVTILWRLEGEPGTSYNMTFDDVKPNQWYTKAIRWAQANSIVNGYSAKQFGPSDSITREQMAAIFFRYAGFKGYDVSARANLKKFADYGKVDTWAADGISWANAAGLMNGVSSAELDPTGLAKRDQVAAILHRFCENIAK